MNPKRYFPDLESERLHLKQLTLGDIDFVFQHFSHPSVTEYLLDEPPLTTLSEAKEIIDFYEEPESKSRNRWGLVMKHDNRVIGTCGFHKWDKRHCRAEIGCDLNPDFWGQGIMTEALRAAMKNGFETMGLHRIDGLIYVKNARSVRLMEKLRFQHEGVLRDYFFLNGQFHDHHLMSLLRKDWQDSL